MPAKKGVTTEAALSRRVRESYERHPYPSIKGDKRPGFQESLVPMGWIEALIQSQPRTIRRILVAGCGTGSEAFALARRFKKAQIVAVDFCYRSIRMARQLQKKFSRPDSLRFLQADLTGPRFKEIAGDSFDLISCHGVLSYVPQLERALRNLAACLKPRGLLYLGVNGSRHFSETWRRALPLLSVDPDSYQDDPRTRHALKVCAALDGGISAWRRMAKPEYVAGDLLTPVLSNLSLSRWRILARGAGLHLMGSLGAHHKLRPLFADDLYGALLPRSRQEVEELVEHVIPAPFHRLIFSLESPPDPPWSNRAELQDWRISRTSLYVASSPKLTGSPASFCHVLLKSAATNSVVEMRVPEWTLKILQESSGSPSLGKILGETSSLISTRSLRKHLYLLYLLTAINVMPSK